MKVIISFGTAVGAIKTTKRQQQLFKDEKIDDKAEVKEDQRKVIRETFGAMAKELAHSKLKPGWGRQLNARKLRPSFYGALSHATGLSNKEIKAKIKQYVTENPDEVLNIAREIANQTGENLSLFTKDEILELVKNSSISSFSLILHGQPKMKAQYLANFILTQIAAQLFNVNITLRDISITYDQMFESGTVAEGWRVEAIVSDKAKSINLMEGFAFIIRGLLANHATEFYLIPPQELLPEQE